MAPSSASPVVIGFNDSPAAEHAVRESAVLLAPCPALVVVVWEAGRAFELADLPTGLLELPPAVLDIRTAAQLDEARYEAAHRLARCGAALAREAGFEAEGLTVADDVTVAETLIRIADEHHAPAIVVGAHGRSELKELLLGSTSHAVIQRARCPVVVVRDPNRS